MSLHACIKDGKVSQLIEISSEEQVYELSVNYSTVVDVSEMSPQPQIGWVIDGININPPAPLSTDLKMKTIMDMRFKFGNDLADAMVKKMSIRNIALINSGQTLNINTVIQTFSTIENAIRKCAIPTAKSALTSILPLYPEYNEEFTYALNEINNYLLSETNL